MKKNLIEIRGNRCERCGGAEDVDLYTIDGVCDDNGNSIGVPLCATCADNGVKGE